MPNEPHPSPIAEEALEPGARVRTFGSNRVVVEAEGWMQSPAVARRFGVKTGTLNKWRQQGKGPKGWKRISPTVVVYPVFEVLKFEQQWKGEESVH